MKPTLASVLLLAIAACPGAGAPGRSTNDSPSPTLSTPWLKLVATVSVGARPSYEIDAGPLAVDAEREELYVAVQCTTDLCVGVRGSVRVVSTRTLKIVRSIPLASNEFLTALEVDPLTGDVYATSTAGRISRLVRGGKRFVLVKSGLGDATGIAIDAARRRIIIAGNTAARVWSFDMKTFRPRWMARLSGRPSTVAVDTVSGRAYVSHSDIARISSIDLTGGVTAIRLPAVPGYIAADEGDGRLLVTQDFIDTSSDPNFPSSIPTQKLSSIEFDTALVTSWTLSEPAPAAVTVDQSWIYVAAGDDPYFILVFDKGSGALIRRMPISSYVEILAASVGRLYALIGNGKLLILSAS